MIPIVNDNFFVDLAAGLGWIPVPMLTEKAMTPDLVKTQLEFLNSQNGPSFYVSTSNPPQFFNRGIMNQTKSWASHTGMFVPETWARNIRQTHGDLLNVRRLPETTTEAGLLPPVPKTVIGGGEILDSQIRFAIQNPLDVVKKGEVVVFFTRDWTHEQAEAITYAGYFQYGAPYDIFEIGSWVSWWMPNLKQIRVCATAIEWISEGRDPHSLDLDNEAKGDSEVRRWLEEKGVDPDRCAPSHMGTYWFNSDKYRPLAFNCDLVEAKNKI